MATVTLEDVRKSFGKTEVIHGVGFDIEDGEFIVIVGPSGCGKSTLLRMVAGLETVTSGEVTIGGARVNDREPMDRDIAMVFQNYALYPHMSVFDNMAYGLKIAKKPKDEIRRRVDEAASLLQISDFLDRRPRELSGGQRQRVAMGRAIVRQPAVFLFDEPLSNLDAKLRVQMRMEIKTLQRRLGITALYVTHDQVEAMTLADRVVVMNAGRVEQIGSPLDVYSEPATTFVAGFIGSPPMNFVSRRAFDGARASELLPAGADDAGTIGIRPEHLELTSPDQAIMSATIVFTEALGAETLLHLEAIDDEIVTLRQAGLPDRSEPGETCHITAAPEHIRLFDANGRRIGSEPGARARTEDRT